MTKASSPCWCGFSYADLRFAPIVIRTSAIHPATKKNKMQQKGYTYILTNKNNTVLYVGVTSDIEKRIWQHRNKILKNTLRKNVHQKSPQILFHGVKAGSPQKKINLINSKNPHWDELYKNI